MKSREPENIAMNVKNLETTSIVECEFKERVHSKMKIYAIKQGIKVVKECRSWSNNAGTESDNAGPGSENAGAEAIMHSTVLSCLEIELK